LLGALQEIAKAAELSERDNKKGRPDGHPVPVSSKKMSLVLW